MKPKAEEVGRGQLYSIGVDLAGGDETTVVIHWRDDGVGVVVSERRRRVAENQRGRR